MRHKKRIEKWKTADLALAAALSVTGFSIEDMERVDARRFNFIFSDTIDLQEIIKRYWKGNLKVEPQAYFNQLKVLKTRVYES